MLCSNNADCANPKDQRSPLNSVGVYKILCSYEQVYIGETGRMVNLRRIKEHQHNVRLKHVTQSALSALMKWTTRFTKRWHSKNESGQETREMHNLYIESTRGSLKNIIIKYLKI